VVEIARRTMLGAGGAIGAALGTGIAALALPTAAFAASGDDGLTVVGRIGDSAQEPATSAQAILIAGATTDGWYWIRTSSMPAAKRVYCNMTDDGGGWMLACYSPDHAGTGSRYPNVWSGGQGALDRMSVDVRELWFHGDAAQCTSVLKMANDELDRAPTLAGMSFANRVTYTNPGGLALNDSGQDELTVSPTSVLSGTWTAVKGHTAMTGPLAITAPSDWIQSTNYWNVCGASTDTQAANGRSTKAEGTYSATHRSLDPLYGMVNATASGATLSRTTKSYAVYIR